MARARIRAELAEFAAALAQALNQVASATRAAWATAQPTEALANAVPYMQAFGHTVLAWIWLDVVLQDLSSEGAESGQSQRGRMMATQYFYRYELPKIGAWLKVVESRDMTCADIPEDAF
jgi:hypothetical protein